MSIIEYITSYQPTNKEMDETPKAVRKYIRALEKCLTEHILK